MAYAIAPLKKSDISELIEIENVSFPAPWTAKMYKQELKNYLAHYWTIRASDHLVAYGGFWLIVAEAHITNIAVHPDFRGRGYGKILMEFLIEMADSLGVQAVTLEVRPTNDVAIALYESIGFQHRGVRPRYYEDNGEDALIMWRVLREIDPLEHPWSVEK